eukprot:5172309-Amphidinium_carterae.1
MTDQCPASESHSAKMPCNGDGLEVEWPCEEVGGTVILRQWFRVQVAAVDDQVSRSRKYLLRFDDGEE